MNKGNEETTIKLGIKYKKAIALLYLEYWPVVDEVDGSPP